ncbi:MAG: hypothetical protein M5R36_22740 [Deltaproteobacteria bacterium]|nr:hypothetical protein [Deltaproteobacteria bacterium]
MRKLLTKWLFFGALALPGVLGGCSDSFFEDLPVYSAHEIVTRENKAEELVWGFVTRVWRRWR